MLLRDVIIGRIQANGPLSFAEFMDLALYEPKLGYYSSANRRSGREGDFITSVDIGSLFGELLARQFGEMWRILSEKNAKFRSSFDIVEAGSGSGFLASDVLSHAKKTDPDFYEVIRYTLVERSPTAREKHHSKLSSHRSKLFGTSIDLPSKVNGIIFANELLDALPVHQIVMTKEGLREVYVDVDVDGKSLIELLGTVSQKVVKHIKRFNIRLEIGWRAEVSPEAISWVERAGQHLEQGFLVLIDYGHEADELYSLAHAHGSLASYQKHAVETGEGHGKRSTPWLEKPGTKDITAHVDLTAVRHGAEQTGLKTLSILDQTYFLLGLASEELLKTEIKKDNEINMTKRSLALKTLLLPGGLGSTHKVLIFSKNIETPKLLGCSFSSRLT
jgi:SAM-dependent MidA family methyltransferase